MEMVFIDRIGYSDPLLYRLTVSSEWFRQLENSSSEDSQILYAMHPNRLLAFPHLRYYKPKNTCSFRICQTNKAIRKSIQLEGHQPMYICQRAGPVQSRTASSPQNTSAGTCSLHRLPRHPSWQSHLLKARLALQKQFSTAAAFRPRKTKNGRGCTPQLHA